MANYKEKVRIVTFLNKGLVLSVCLYNLHVLDTEKNKPFAAEDGSDKSTDTDTVLQNQTYTDPHRTFYAAYV